VVSQCFSETACSTKHEFIVVNGQTTTSAFHKVVQQQYCGPNYGYLRLVSLWCCMPKIIKGGQCFTELFKK